jgi:hypothetical protein
MAGGTLYASRDMNRVREMHIARFFVYPNPRYWLLSYVIASQYRNLRVSNGDVFMATPAHFLWRIICESRRCRGPMAISAWNMQFGDVNVVIKRYWLCRARCANPICFPIVRHLGPKKGSCQKSDEYYGCCENNLARKTAQNGSTRCFSWNLNTERAVVFRIPD